jgi:acyl-[acyl-carrier-protein]-phospholipid O-acyltransferase/long-chain-fatty-acid--[acyl-carrier-protein] ligase
VEDALQRALPEGVWCAVLEVPDALRGSRIVAAVTATVDERAVTARLSAEVARIALPRHFVQVAELPKMPSGKIDYRSLTETVRDAVQKLAPA